MNPSRYDGIPLLRSSEVQFGFDKCKLLLPLVNTRVDNNRNAVNRDDGTGKPICELKKLMIIRDMIQQPKYIKFRKNLNTTG